MRLLDSFLLGGKHPLRSNHQATHVWLVEKNIVGQWHIPSVAGKEHKQRPGPVAHVWLKEEKPADI